MPKATPKKKEPTEAPVVEVVEESVHEDEMNVFVPPDEVLMSSLNKKVAFPKLSWRLEAKILKIIGRLVKAVPGLKDIDFMNFQPTDFLSVASDLLITAPEYVEELLKLAYPDLEEADMEEATLEDVADLLVPLFYAIAASLFTLMAKVGGPTPIPSAA